MDPDLRSNGIKRSTNQKWQANLLGSNAASDMKRQDFVHFFCYWKTENQNFSIVGTGTAVNHYGSTTLLIGQYNLSTDSVTYITDIEFQWPGDPGADHPHHCLQSGLPGSRTQDTGTVPDPTGQKLYCTMPGRFWKEVIYCTRARQQNYRYLLNFTWTYVDCNNVSVGSNNLPECGSGSRLCYYSEIKSSHFKVLIEKTRSLKVPSHQIRLVWKWYCWIGLDMYMYRGW